MIEDTKQIIVESELQRAMLETISSSGPNIKRLIDELFQFDDVLDTPPDEGFLGSKSNSGEDSEGEGAKSPVNTNSQDGSGEDSEGEGGEDSEGEGGGNSQSEGGGDSEGGVGNDSEQSAEDNFQGQSMSKNCFGGNGGSEETPTPKGLLSIGNELDEEEWLEFAYSRLNIDNEAPTMDELEQSLANAVSVRDTLEELCEKNKSLVKKLLVNKDVLGVVKLTLNGLKKKSGGRALSSGDGISYGDRDIIWSMAPIYNQTLFLERYAKKTLLCDASEPFGSGRIHFVVDASDSMGWLVSQSLKMQRFDFQMLICFAFGGNDNRYHPFDCRALPSRSEDEFFSMRIGRGTKPYAFMNKIGQVQKEWKDGDSLVMITDGEFRLDSYEKDRLDTFASDKNPVIILIGEDAKLKLGKGIKKRVFKMTTPESLTELNQFLQTIIR